MVNNRNELVEGEFGVRQLAAALQRGSPPPAQLAAPKLVARLRTAQLSHGLERKIRERQQAGAEPASTVKAAASCRSPKRSAPNN